MNLPLLRIALPRVSAIVRQCMEAAPSGSDLRGKAAIASRRIAAPRLKNGTCETMSLPDSRIARQRATPSKKRFCYP
jgi:hypothetical protein